MAAPKDREPLLTGVTAENALEKFNELTAKTKENPELLNTLGPTTVGNPYNLGSRVLSAGEWKDKQIRRATAAGEDWLKGSLAPRRNPKESALKADGKRKDRLAQAEKEEKWKKAVSAYDEEERIATINAVGSSGFVNGITARSGKIGKKIDKLQPLVAQVAATIDAMPDATETDRVNRMTTNLKLMKELPKKMAGG
jgi:hypothetical protein